MWLKEVIVESWQSLTRHRLRSTLTMLGITWGLVTVVLLLGYGQGVGESVFNAFMGIGNNVILSWGGQTSMQAGGERAGRRIHFKYEDIQALRDEVPLLKGVSAEDDSNLPYKYENRVITISSKAVQFPYGAIRKLNVEEGRYFEEADFIEHRRVVIFGPLAAKRIFGGINPVGQYVSVRGQDFLIIGVLQLKIQDSSNNGPDNQNVFLPFETYRDVMDVRDPGMIVYAPLNPSLHLKAREAVRAVLARRHHFDPRDDKATQDWDTVEDAQQIQQFSIALQIILGIIGALTLGVGGVGVMNIMLVSVTERTREIGLRKAVGARKFDILGQFLVEALVLTFIGGALGMVLAGVIAHTVPAMPLHAEEFHTANHEGDIFLRTSPVVLLASFFILSAVGVVSGFWPALKAAQMEPVEALRYE
ncbi:MAG: ABC transporter permease [Acidobacteriia bacterium]|nr:ABC transporter permease [Terriglobia bacterium]